MVPSLPFEHERDLIADDAAVIYTHRPWTELPKLLSLHNPGQVWYSPDCIVIHQGSRSFYLIHYSATKRVLKARETTEQLGIKPGWSVGSCARRIWQWIGHTQTFNRHARQWVQPGWHFLACKPGRYDTAALYDIRSAYYTLLTYANGLEVYPTKTGIEWAVCSGKAWERFQQALNAVWHNKPLRNSLVGTAWGGDGIATAWCRGKRIQIPMKPGPLRPLAALIVRSTFELCAEAFTQTNAVYAHTDCVITPSGTPPQCWTAHGLDYKTEATGQTDIVACGVYHVGEKATLWWNKGARWPLPIQPPPLPKHLLHHDWL